MKNAYLIVMAGGSGTRFWPKSTSRKPKQLLSFGTSKEGPTLLRQTIERFDGIVPASQRVVITTRSLRESVRSAVPAGTEVLAEPAGRNTAPCVYWAARYVAERDPRGLMLVMPADHYMADVEAFQKTVVAACERAQRNDDLVTLGVAPSRPETGYGYLRTGARVEGSCLRVDAFVEKPDLSTAERFLREGNYLWNGGMFLWRADVILSAFDRFMPEMRAAWEETRGEVDRAYPKMTATSIDYGVMEKASNVVTFPLECGWDDLGNWTSLESLAEQLGARHAAGVVTAGECLAVGGAQGNIVDVPGKLVALLGVEDLIIVEQGDALLVARKDRAQDIRKVVDEVKALRPDLA